MVYETEEGFTVSNGQKEVTFGWVFKEGAFKNQSEYFIATEDSVKNAENLSIGIKKARWAVYSIKTLKRVSPVFDWISPLGLVKGQSPYYRGTLNGKEALFTLTGQKTDWFDKIRDRGALTGESPYYWGKKNGYYALYHIETGKKLTEDFKSSVIAGALLGRGSLVVGSYGEEIFFIYDIEKKEKISPEFDEDALIQILKHGDLERALKELSAGQV
ncbi:hypothetical protein [Persephonella sp.]